MNHIQRSPTIILLLNIVAIILAYYVSILLHEWGHSTVAWLYGVKNSPFDIQYGGWFLMNADENVNYASLIQYGRGIAAALIGVAGPIVSFTFVVVSFILLNSKKLQNYTLLFILVYWFLMINMIPLVQYLAVSAFSSDGDTGRFVNGLNISAWWIFVPGTIFIIFSLWIILTIEIIKAYTVIPIKSILGQNIFLLTTLAVIFLFIYSHGYNPLTDTEIDTFSRALAIISIILVPILFIICNPSRSWVKKKVNSFTIGL